MLRYYVAKATVSTRGQLQLPKDAMTRFNIEKSDILTFFDISGFNALDQAEADKHQFMIVAVEKNPENIERKEEEKTHYL